MIPANHGKIYIPVTDYMVMITIPLLAKGKAYFRCSGQFRMFGENQIFRKNWGYRRAIYESKIFEKKLLKR